ncbi:MAG: DNA mismatch repair endonuclease MutL [Thermomicrobiales bacterium]|nr:DNA mismatch repair endonuclease MutL [Thermomicrobiales bacterium]MCO5228541.1 DNA mismatch repair endonuclease MutL [Thermomicrobiales bacterium]
MPIQLLTEETIGKIAAGEVVERPMSVVKELIENAIDAGATRIDVEIEEGGNKLIRVTDNGCGMSLEELPLAVTRHATSKLSSFDDLETLHTLGFRGEALPSIGSVASLSIRSGSTSGSGSIAIDYGRNEPPRIDAAPRGTTVTVRDLFGNVPARRKFLRQPSTEATYINRLISAYACHRSDIQWTLTSDGRTSIRTDGRGNDESAAIGVFGNELRGNVLLLGEMSEEMRVPGVTVSGWISSPAVHRSHRQSLHFFVNGRLIQHRALVFALEEAYHSLLMVQRHPLGMVRIEVDPAAVDVNVHPTKAEVKFADERAVARAVQRAAHSTLLTQRNEVLPEITFEPVPRARLEPTQITFSSGADPIPLSPDQRLDSRVRTEDVAHTPVEPSANPSGIPVLRVLGQVSGTYIIAEGPNGMFLIDQHAAHERIMYEKILAQMQAKAVDQQAMLDPLVIELPPDELAIFEKSVDELNQIGYDTERFGESSIIIRAIPALVRGVDVTIRFHEILCELVDGGAGDSWMDSVAISASCHTSIRAGQSLSLPEMRELVAQLERCEHPRACGHGRPTMLHMSQAELERQFNRR